MKAKLKIVHENGMYVGYALKSNEVVYKTTPYKDSFSCSRDLAKNADKHQKPIKPVPLTRPNRSIQPPTTASTTSIQHLPPSPTPHVKPKRSCCGRG